MSEPISDASRMVGAVLGRRYKLTRLLGEGGMGAVFAATELQDGSTFAIKVLHPEYVGEAQVAGRFFAEAQTVQRMSHPNIVRVFDVGTAEDGTPYMVMELLEGRSLGDALQQSGALGVPFAVGLFVGALEALGYAHGQGIVHRDLKPDNLFVIPGMSPHLKLVDFGIAKVMDQAGGMGTRTRTGMLLGTPAYMSPEQLKNSKGVDARTDLWSMTVILYEMLTCKDAFPGETPMEQMTVVLMGNTTPIGQHSPHLAPLEPFFARAFDRDVANRFQTAAEMSAALLALVSPPSPPPGQPLPPMDKSVFTTQLSAPRPVDAPAPKPDINPGQVQIVPPGALPSAPATTPAKPGGSKLWLIPVVLLGLFCVAAGLALGLWALNGR
jgi:eukaryotic-like serine/threonine-protein kinase